MGADLRHQEHFVAAPVPERPAQDRLSLAVVVLPGVVEEANTCIYGLMNELHRFIQGWYIAEVMTTHADSRDVFTGASKFAINHVSRPPPSMIVCATEPLLAVTVLWRLSGQSRDQRRWRIRERFSPLSRELPRTRLGFLCTRCHTGDIVCRAGDSSTACAGAGGSAKVRAVDYWAVDNTDVESRGSIP